MIDISIASIKEIDELKYDVYLSLLPEDLRQDILKYQLKEDRYRRVIGKIILLDYLKKYTGFNLSDIQRTSFNKPYIDDSNIDFSISYSNNYIVCAFAKNFSIGVDIEVLNPNINIEEFENIFTTNEFELILNSREKIELFYRFWTIKEAVLKADGRGFSYNPRDISIDFENGKATIENRVYNLMFFKLSNYLYTLATYQKN